MSAVSEKRRSLKSALGGASPEEMRACLRRFASDLVEEVAAAAPEHSEEVLNTLIAELALSAADQRRLRERRQKQAEGIAAAQARGVRFGRPAAPLPEGFDEYHQAWREGRISLQQAADACGIPKATFYGIATRREQACAG